MLKPAVSRRLAGADFAGPECRTSLNGSTCTTWEGKKQHGNPENK